MKPRTTTDDYLQRASTATEPDLPDLLAQAAAAARHRDGCLTMAAAWASQAIGGRDHRTEPHDGIDRRRDRHHRGDRSERHDNQGWEALRLGRPLWIAKSLFEHPDVTFPDKLAFYGAEALTESTLPRLLALLPKGRRDAPAELPF